MTAATCAMMAAFAGAQLGVSVDNPTPYGYVNSTSGGLKTVTSNNVTATAHFGTGPYNYAWAYVSGSNAISAATPGANVTYFTASLGIGQAVTADFRVTATDSAGSPAATADVSVTLENVDLR